jgi:hypothetical protein
VPGWNTKDYGPGILDAEKLLQAPLPGTLRAATRAKVTAAPPEQTLLAAFSNLLPELSPAELRRRLATALDATPATLPARLREVGDEFFFHLAVNAEERDRFAGRGAARGKAASKAALATNAAGLRAAASPTLAKYLA